MGIPICWWENLPYHCTKVLFMRFSKVIEKSSLDHMYQGVPPHCALPVKDRAPTTLFLLIATTFPSTFLAGCENLISSALMKADTASNVLGVP